jgi:hypothetical protein
MLSEPLHTENAYSFLRINNTIPYSTVSTLQYVAHVLLTSTAMEWQPCITELLHIHCKTCNDAQIRRLTSLIY